MCKNSLEIKIHFLININPGNLDAKKAQTRFKNLFEHSELNLTSLNYTCTLIFPMIQNREH